MGQVFSDHRGTLQAQQPLSIIQTAMPQDNHKSLASPELLAWLKNLIRENLPEKYVDDRKWNKQREVVNGLHIKLDGLKLHTHRNRTLVNAGTWTRYEIDFVDPSQYLQVEFQRLDFDQKDTIQFETTVIAPLDIEGQLAEWVRDVKIISLTAHAAATVRLTVSGKVRIQLNMLKLPPDIVIKPLIQHAKVELLEYRVRRISKIEGDAAMLLVK